MSFYIIGTILLLLTVESLTLANEPFRPPVSPLPPLGYTSYLQNAVCLPAEEIRYPKTIEDVTEIVKEAISRQMTVKAFGHRHSITDIICTNGIPIDMRGFREISYNSEDQTVTVGAGVYLNDLTTYLRQNGRALKTTPAFGNITIGGAVGTGAHGSSIKYNSSISSQVRAVTIVDGLGQLQKIIEESELNAFRVHLGLLGIVIDVTLDTHPLYKVRAHNYVSSDDVLTSGNIIEIARNTDQASIYWFPSFKKVVICNWTIVDVNTRGKAITNDHVPPTTNTFNDFASPAVEVLQHLNSLTGLNTMQGYSMQALLRTVPEFAPIYTENGRTVKNPAVGFYDLMFAPICKSKGFVQCPWLHGPNNNLTFLDNELSLDLDQLPDFVKTIKDILSKSAAVFPLFGILLRFSAASPIYMHSSYKRDSCHFEFYMMKRKNSYEKPSVGLAAYQTILQSLAMNYTGRSHWGKSGLHYHSSEMLNMKLDPEARSSFIAKMNQYDPNGIFLNNFGRRLKGEGMKIDTDPATTHCALLDTCVCVENNDCAKRQICTSLKGYEKYRICDYPSTVQIPLNQFAYSFNTTFNLQQLLCTSELGSAFEDTLSCQNYTNSV